jgi:hypothetical protein
MRVAIRVRSRNILCRCRRMLDLNGHSLAVHTSHGIRGCRGAVGNGGGLASSSRPSRCRTRCCCRNSYRRKGCARAIRSKAAVDGGSADCLGAAAGVCRPCLCVRSSKGQSRDRECFEQHSSRHSEWWKRASDGGCSWCNRYDQKKHK